MMHTRAIPSTGEALPVVGCGTYLGFDQPAGDASNARLGGVLDALFAAGGRLVDSSPMYGRAEARLGDALADDARAGRAFVATKVWTSGRRDGERQIEQSFERLRVDRIDLLQVHNLLDWREQLATLRGLKAAGRIRYLGITHYTASAHAQVEAVLRAEALDFLQINVSVDEPEAAARLLPVAAERGVAVIANRPFGGGGFLRRCLQRPLPAWAAEIGCAGWPALLLKAALAHPAVTCVIPGSGDAAHMAANAQAGEGELPGPDYWRDKLAALRS